MPGTLYVVATPIGNAEDITGRARRILAQVDIIAAEDTRLAQKLLGILGIRNKTVSNHKFNEVGRTDGLLAELMNDKNIALISDAGTPCVSDPGGVLVQAAADCGIAVVGVSGASAVVTALSVCGFVFRSFAFYGFFPRTAGEIANSIDRVRGQADVSVFFESPRRIKATLEVLAEHHPDAKICLCNDLTKLYERIYRGEPRGVLAQLQDNPSAEKGEYTMVIHPGTPPPPDEDDGLSPEALLADCLAKSGGTAKQAIAVLAADKDCAYTKKELYAASLRLKALFAGDEYA